MLLLRVRMTGSQSNLFDEGPREDAGCARVERSDSLTGVSMSCSLSRTVLSAMSSDEPEKEPEKEKGLDRARDVRESLLR